MDTKRQYIKHLYTLNLEFYRNTKKERIELSDWEQDKGYSVVGYLEIRTADLSGISEQIVETGQIPPEQQQWVEKLREGSLFELPFFMKWYVETESFTNLKQYARMLDYWRLVILEYLK